jgi:hypothetical protein
MEVDGLNVSSGRGQEVDPEPVDPSPVEAASSSILAVDGSATLAVTAATTDRLEDSNESGTTIGDLVRSAQAAPPEWDPSRPRTTWDDLYAYMVDNQAMYVIEAVFESGCVFWAETVPSWHRMLAGINSYGFGCHPYVQVEFHMGDVGEVDWALLGKMPDRFLSGLLVVERSVRVVTRRHLWTLDTHQYDLLVGELNAIIVSHCMATGTTPPPGHWSATRPTFA